MFKDFSVILVIRALDLEAGNLSSFPNSVTNHESGMNVRSLDISLLICIMKKLN